MRLFKMSTLDEIFLHSHIFCYTTTLSKCISNYVLNNYKFLVCVNPIYTYLTFYHIMKTPNSNDLESRVV